MNNTVCWKIARRLAHLREAHDYKLARVASAAGVSISTCWKWENGTPPRVDHLAKVVALYGMTLEQFFGPWPKGQATNFRAGEKAVDSDISGVSSP